MEFPNTGATNESGFTALAGGGRDRANGLFYSLGSICTFGLQHEVIADYALDTIAWLRPDSLQPKYIRVVKYDGFSVRCVHENILTILLQFHLLPSLLMAHESTNKLLLYPGHAPTRIMIR